MSHYRIFKPTKFRPFNKKTFGFDIETYGQKNKFYCGSIVGDKETKTFFDKEELINYFKLQRFKDAFVVATNLSFDFMGVFNNHPDLKNFSYLFRGSDLLFTKSHIVNKKFMSNENFREYKRKNDIKGHKPNTLTFIDTLNYAKNSVNQLGKILGLPKLITPSYVTDEDSDYWRKPKTKSERDELVTYNIRDSEISKKYFDFLCQTFSSLGATPKNTIASTSMSLFKNKYLKQDFFGHDVDILKNLFEGYYGGRVETLKRGTINKGWKIYDFNSLYPSVMHDNVYPNPNRIRVSHMNYRQYLDSYDGVTLVDVKTPELNVPFLPVRTEDKLLFPTGTFKGWYSNVELRKAIDLGYDIVKVYKSIYFTENLEPFKEFVTDLYNLRRKFQRENNPMELVCKLILNAHYGKYGEKFIDKDRWYSDNLTLEELEKFDDFEHIGNFFRVKVGEQEPRSHCIPEWALYTTAYGRIKLYDAIRKSNPIYYDTDSLITRKTLDESSKLGALKLEHRIKEGIMVKPKMYAYVNDEYKECVKCKGLNTYGWGIDNFYNFIKNPEVKMRKFVKFKEAQRRKLTPNEIIFNPKVVDLNDTKRVWSGEFTEVGLISSEPVKI